MGCGACSLCGSTPESAVIDKSVSPLPNPTSSSPLPSPPPSPPPSPLPEMDIIEDFVIVWLDASLDRNSDEIQKIEKKLQEIVNVVMTYTDPRECLAFILSVNDEKIFLILSDAHVKRFVPKVQNLPQIESIYRFCPKKEAHEQQININSERPDQYTSIEKLCEKLKEDIKKCEHDMVNFAFMGGSSLETVSEVDQPMVCNEFVRSISLQGASANNQNITDDEFTEGTSFKIETKYNQQTTVDESTEETQSKIFTTNNQRSNNNKLNGGSLSKIGTNNNEDAESQNSTGESFSKARPDDNQDANSEEYTRESLSKVEANNNQQKALPIQNQLFREMVLGLKGDEKVMKEVYDFCREHYQNNPTELDFIKELEKTYQKRSPIYWYTREGCLYKILNKALRIHRYDRLYSLRAYIYYLHEQIAELYEKNKCEFPKLYRGQGWGKAEFECNPPKEGELMFVSSFWSTSTSFKIAKEFAERAVIDEKNLGVLMEIKVDGNVRFPVANIKELSAIKKEEEWLFSFGSVFRIDAVKHVDGIWRISLTLTSDSEEQRVALTKYYKHCVEDENIRLSFARLIHLSGDWKRSRDFYEKSLETESLWYRKAATLNNIGSITSQLSEYSAALEHYKKSLEIELEVEDSDYKDLATTYNNIGTLYYKEKKMDKAVKNFQLAIEAYNKTPNGDQETIATLYNNIASVLNCQGEHEKALENNKRCLKIRVNILPSIHPSLATAYNNTASTYHYLRSSALTKEDGSKAVEYAKNAVKCAQEAVSINNQALPPDHPQTKIHKENLDRFNKELSALEQ